MKFFYTKHRYLFDLSKKYRKYFHKVKQKDPALRNSEKVESFHTTQAEEIKL